MLASFHPSSSRNDSFFPENTELELLSHSLVSISQLGQKVHLHSVKQRSSFITSVTTADETDVVASRWTFTELVIDKSDRTTSSRKGQRGH